jgi:hypothetical protein
VTRQSVVGRWSGVSELVLAPWEGSVTRRGGVATSTGGEVASGRGKGGGIRSIQLLQMDVEDLNQ